jgi:hypothetical protein
VADIKNLNASVAQRYQDVGEQEDMRFELLNLQNNQIAHAQSVQENSAGTVSVVNSSVNHGHHQKAASSSKNKDAV